MTSEIWPNKSVLAKDESVSADRAHPAVLRLDEDWVEDVTLVNPQNGEMLVYDSLLGKWTNVVTDVKSLRLYVDSLIFSTDAAGDVTPDYITLEAKKANVSGTVTWVTTPAVSLFAATTGGSPVTTGDVLYLRKANMGTNRMVSITTSIATEFVSDKTAIYAISDGSELTVLLDNPYHFLPTTTAGVVTYTGSGTKIRVVQGTTYLNITACTPAPTGVTLSVTPIANLGTSEITVATHTAIAGDNGRVTYTLTVTRIDGTSTTVRATQTLAKLWQGGTGARGSVTRYLTNAWSQASDWVDATVAALFPSSPISGDTATVTNGTTFTLTKVYSGSAWVAPGTVIDGNLIVTKSIQATSINTFGLTIVDAVGDKKIGLNSSGKIELLGGAIYGEDFIELRGAALGVEASMLTLEGTNNGNTGRAVLAGANTGPGAISQLVLDGKAVAIDAGTLGDGTFTVAADVVDFYANFNVQAGHTVTLPSASVSPAAIALDSDNRFVTDAQKTAWDAKQAGDLDLSAIAGLAGTSGLLKKTNTNVWTLDTATYATTEQLVGKTNMYGFPVDTSGNYLCTLTYNETTRTVTLTPTVTSFDVIVGGVRYTKTGAQSVVHLATGDSHFIHYNSAGTLVVTTTPWDLLTTAPVCFVFQDVTNSRRLPFEERHHAGRDVYWHRNQHAAEGTKATGSGFIASGYTLNTTGDTANTFGISSGRLEDEDIQIDTEALPDGGPYFTMRRNGAAGSWLLERTNTVPYYRSGTNTQYNQYTGATWQLTTLANNDYVNYYLFGVTALPQARITPAPGCVQQFVVVPGQQVFTSAAAASGDTVASLAWGTVPFQEIVPIYRLTYRYSSAAGGTSQLISITRVVGTNANITAAALTDHGSLSGLADLDHPASAIIFTSTGSIAATTVQAAIAELDTEKQASLVSGTNIKTISGVSILGSGDIPGSDATTIAGYPVTVSSILEGDVLQYSGGVWINSVKDLLTDGGNF